MQPLAKPVCGSAGKTGLPKPRILTGMQKVYVLAETPEHSCPLAAGPGSAGLSCHCPRGWIDGCPASASRAPLSRRAESSFLESDTKQWPRKPGINLQPASWLCALLDK